MTETTSFHVDARESFGSLELALEDRGWRALTSQGETQFTQQGLVNAANVCRVMAVANPLIRRGLALRSAYVFGSGVTPSAASEGQDVSAVIRAWWEENAHTLTGEVATERLERVLGTDGNLLFVNHTNPLTGLVQVRTIPFEEVTDKLTNPEDASETWFYRREYEARTLIPSADGATTVTETRRKVVYYPDINYRPSTRPKSIAGIEIRWDAPIHHVIVNDLEGWQWGIGDAYAAVTWARSYRDFLADWATLVKSLSQFAWRATASGSKAARIRESVARIGQSATPANPGGVGATAITSPDVTLEAIPKTGATVDSESGRPLAAMVGAALDIPVTVLLADPGVTGARATAETLDRPLYEAMKQRQGVWQDALRTMGQYAILQAVKAPQGGLRGTITRDKWTGRETLTLAGDVDPQLRFEFPDLDAIPLDSLMAAIKTADDTGKLPPATIARLLLVALRVDDVDKVMGDLVDEDGTWLDPAVTAAQAQGAAAVQAFREGRA